MIITIITIINIVVIMIIITAVYGYWSCRRKRPSDQEPACEAGDQSTKQLHGGAARPNLATTV